MAERETAREIAQPAVSLDDVPLAPVHKGVLGRIKAWVLEEGPWWSCSFIFHAALVCSLALMGGRVVEKVVDEAPSFEQTEFQKPVETPQQIERFEVGETPADPTELSPDTLAMDKPNQMTQDEKRYDTNPISTEKSGGAAFSGGGEQGGGGGIGGLDVRRMISGSTLKGKGSAGVGVGTGIHVGRGGGDGHGFGTRTSQNKAAMLGSGGGTRQSERSVGGALNWIARHQSPDGSWGLSAYKARCSDASCTGGSKIGECKSGATALSLLPFLGAGLTHRSSGRYKQTVYAGVAYLVKNQKPDGDLRMGDTMYAHGLASIALCECYGMTGDKPIRQAAQAALDFIMLSQDPVGGGWRYEPRAPGDTSVTGWQLMALKSGQMAYLNVSSAVIEKAKRFLASTSKGARGSLGLGGLFGYMPKDEPTPSMSAVGLLISQYLGTARTDPAMVEGTALLMKNLPGAGARNLYYWYYATQVMHNQPGHDWDVWNRQMRHFLIDTQCKGDNCAAGSWDPIAPNADAHGPQVGRLYVTTISALMLEVYYRFLPLYQLEGGDGGASAPASAADKPASKPASKPAEQNPGKPTPKPAK